MFRRVECKCFNAIHTFRKQWIMHLTLLQTRWSWNLTLCWVTLSIYCSCEKWRVASETVRGPKQGSHCEGMSYMYGSGFSGFSFFYKILSFPGDKKKQEVMGLRSWASWRNQCRNNGRKTECTVIEIAKEAAHGVCFTADRTLPSVRRQIIVTVRVFNWRLDAWTSETSGELHRPSSVGENRCSPGKSDLS